VRYVAALLFSAGCTPLEVNFGAEEMAHDTGAVGSDPEGDADDTDDTDDTDEDSDEEDGKAKAVDGARARLPRQVEPSATVQLTAR
jgi:hypothetical protein